SVFCCYCPPYAVSVYSLALLFMRPLPPCSTLFPYTTLFRSFLDTFIQLPIITPYAIDLGASHVLTGAIVAIYSFTNMIGNICKRSEEHTSELQSRFDLVCRLLLEKKNKKLNLHCICLYCSCT